MGQGRIGTGKGQDIHHLEWRIPFLEKLGLFRQMGFESLNRYVDEKLIVGFSFYHAVSKSFFVVLTSNDLPHQLDNFYYCQNYILETHARNQPKTYIFYLPFFFNNYCLIKIFINVNVLIQTFNFCVYSPTHYFASCNFYEQERLEVIQVIYRDLLPLCRKVLERWWALQPSIHLFIFTILNELHSR